MIFCLIINCRSRSVLFRFLAALDPSVGHTMDVLSPFISVLLIDSSTGSPVHVLMLSIQAVRGLPCLRAPDIVRSTPPSQPNKAAFSMSVRPSVHEKFLRFE